MGEGGAGPERERSRAGVSLSLRRGGSGGVSRIFRVRNHFQAQISFIVDYFETFLLRVRVV